MKICESWLREWVSPPLTTELLSNQLTMAGLEVDACYPVAGVFDHVVVAEVVQTKRHPEADKLTICHVDAGTGEHLQIVCGASNVRAGLKVALAMIGARLPNDFRIKPCKLRGEVSQGMLCSTSELGMEEQSCGILELPNEAPVGMDLREYLKLEDHVFDIDLTPNRADCLSVLGVARDVAALNHLPYKELPHYVVEPTITDTLDIIIDKPDACPSYVGRVICGIQSSAETPIWMKERLRRSGARSIHPVVDILNYVMLELGQPMHAFDLKTLNGSLCVRQARDGETLTLLDEQSVTLTPAVLIIADEKHPVAMAGVMGGEASSVKSDTVDIFLESAFFSPLFVAGVARHYGLSTDASQRFERGVDPLLQRTALEYATTLIQQIAGGHAGPLQIKIQKEHLPQRPSIDFHPSRVERLTGLCVEQNKMLSILENLNMQVATSQGYWQVVPPSYRFDIQCEADIVEEIVRIRGYDKIEAKPMVGEMRAGKINQIQQLNEKLSVFFSDRGYQETISYSFVDPDVQEALYPGHSALSLLNPISSDLSQMRTGLWGGLIAVMIHNLHRQQNALRLFESGVVFHDEHNQLIEVPHIAGLITGDYGHSNWTESSGTYDFYDLKGDLEAMFSLLGSHRINFIPTTHPALHPGKSAKMMYGDITLGDMGALHPALMDALDIQTDVYLFELSLKPLLNLSKLKYQPISKYPQMRRDLSLIVAENTSAGEIEAAIRSVVETSYLKSFDVFDVYHGASIPEGKKSLAIALTFQSNNRTLVDAEIQSMIASIVQKLEGSFSAILRTE